MKALHDTLDFHDLFCGAGGSSSGMKSAGFELRLAANHDQRSIETHSYNHPEADHLCVDINHLDMRRLPRALVLWASVICTEGSPAGGKRKTRGQLELLEYGPIAAATFERTRACALDVYRATDLHRYAAVVVENVVEFARDWEGYQWWIEGMCALKPGYNVQVVSASAAHIGGPGNLHAPQWRDRIYIVFTRKGVRTPDLKPRPVAWCFECGELVHAIQAWKRDRGPYATGKYRQQYLYRCPNMSCRHAEVEPYVRPAISAIDLNDVGERIGDKKNRLAESTRRRVGLGIEWFWQPTIVAAAGNTYEAGSYIRAWPALDAPLNARQCTDTDGIAIPPLMISVNHSGEDARACPAEGAPLPSRTTKLGDGVVHTPFMVYGYTRDDETRVKPIDDPLGAIVAAGGHHQLVSPPAPFLTMLRRNANPRSVEDALDTLATARHHYLTIPPAFLLKQYGGNCRDENAVQAVDHPLGSITTKDHHYLVIPYRRGKAKTTAEPLHTLTTHDSAALVRPAIEVDDCYFRMLNPREHARGQRFADNYKILGNKGEQTAQAGNAVACNTAQWIGEALTEVLA